MKIEHAITLSRLILQFGQVFRVTMDADGRLESDTTHSLALAMMAGELAAAESVPLDRWVVMSLALVHDLAEVYAGDTSTIRALSPDAHADKERREAESLARVRVELAGFPWVLELIERYEAQICFESRFVRYLDKVMPKLTHRDNGCRIPIAHGMTLEECQKRHRSQGLELAERYPEFRAVRALFEAACEDSESQWGKRR